jgi:polysaccharide deacetylase family sporulation protein PdaB
MRGNRANRRKKHALSGALFMMVIGVVLGGCSIIQVLNDAGMDGSGVVVAAPAGTAENGETATETGALATTAADPTVPTDPSGAAGIDEETEGAVPDGTTETATPPPSPTPKPDTATPPTIDQTDNNGKKLVALTFDDGPDNKYTTQVLDILKKNDVKATFFLVGTQVEKYPDTAKRIVDEGHSIGNHTWSHKDLTKQSDKVLDLEIDRTQEAIEDATGITPHLMRAPYGAFTDKVLNKIHTEDMKHIYWTVDTRDWAGTSVSTMHKNVLANTHQGAIILMHSFGGRKNALEHTITLLPSIIKDLRAKGYTFVTVDELIASGQAHDSVVK